MGKECKKCWVGCKYLKKKATYMSAVVDGKMEPERARELIDNWRAEAVTWGCDELGKMPDIYENE